MLQTSGLALACPCWSPEGGGSEGPAWCSCDAPVPRSPGQCLSVAAELVAQMLGRCQLLRNVLGKRLFVLTQKSMSQLGCRVTPPPLNLCPHVLPSIHDTQPGLVLTHAVPAERWVEPKACTCPWSQKESSVSMQPGRRCPRPLAWGPCPEPGSAGQGHRGFELSPLHEAGVGGPAGPCWAAQTLRTGGFNIKKKIGFHVILLT